MGWGYSSTWVHGCDVGGKGGQCTGCETCSYYFMRQDKPLTPSLIPLSTPTYPHPSPQSVPWNFCGGTYYAPEEWKVYTRTQHPSYSRDIRFVDTQEYFDGHAADMYRIGTVALQILEQITWIWIKDAYPIHHADYPLQRKL